MMSKKEGEEIPRTAWENFESGILYSTVHFAGARPIVITEDRWIFWDEEKAKKRRMAACAR